MCAYICIFSETKKKKVFTQCLGLKTKKTVLLSHAPRNETQFPCVRVGYAARRSILIYTIFFHGDAAETRFRGGFVLLFHKRLSFDFLLVSTAFREHGFCCGGHAGCLYYCCVPSCASFVVLPRMLSSFSRRSVIGISVCLQEENCILSLIKLLIPRASV